MPAYLSNFQRILPLFLSDLPRIIYVGLVNLAIAILLQIVATFTDHWYIGSGKNYGIFTPYLTDFTGSILAFELTAVSCGLGAAFFILLFLRLYHKRTITRSKFLPIFTLLLCIYGVFCSLIGWIMVFFINNLRMGYSSILCILGEVLFIVAGILLRIGSFRLLNASAMAEQEDTCPIPYNDVIAQDHDRNISMQYLQHPETANTPTSSYRDDGMLIA